MHNPTYVVTGTVTDADTVKLDESLPIHSAKVRVTIEPIEVPKVNRYSEVMAEIRQRQQARNHQPPTAEEVERYMREEREGWR